MTKILIITLKLRFQRQRDGVASDDKSSYVILSMFFSYFHYDVAAKRRSIRIIAYDFRTFVMFSIFESIILVFPKHSNFRGFLEKFTKVSCKSANQE